MKTQEIWVVRIYLVESSGHLKKIINYLKNDAKINGISVFRAISGYGETGEHSASILDLSLDLPITIEFFDDRNIIENAIAFLKKEIKPKHMIFWPAQTHVTH